MSLYLDMFRVIIVVAKCHGATVADAILKIAVWILEPVPVVKP
jgi:hypothetical protein